MIFWRLADSSQFIQWAVSCLKGNSLISIFERQFVYCSSKFLYHLHVVHGMSTHWRDHSYPYISICLHVSSPEILRGFEFSLFLWVSTKSNQISFWPPSFYLKLKLNLIQFPRTSILYEKLVPDIKYRS
jgi:hypothetical protein